jgi:aldehyde:ferredoxin oxidoreductase
MMVEYGYAGEILRIDLSSRRITKLNTAEYAERFLGGRGIAAKIYWDEVKSEVKAFDPQNPFICITGPIAGFPRFSGCRWQVCGKSAEMEPESFTYGNLGGSWGSWLKYAGYDGLVVTGRAERPAYIYIDDRGTIEIREAAHLWGKTAVEARSILQSELGQETRVLDIGPAGENLVTFATVLAAENASGSGGFGAVMGSKNLKAVAIKADQKKRPAAADPQRLHEIANLVYKLRKANFEDYGHILPLKIDFVACYGCISGCTRGMYTAGDGQRYKSFCQASGVYMGPAMKFYGGKGQEAALLAGRLCDAYGLDTAVLAPMITWISQCCEAGILNEAETGLPLSKIGSIEFIESLFKQICYREGFGDILAGGTIRAAEYIGKGAREFIRSSGIMTRASETKDHDPRLILANALFFATEPRRSVYLVHAASIPLGRWFNQRKGWKDAYMTTGTFQKIARKFWGSEEAGDFTTYEGKAQASRNIQNYGYVKESLILCDLAWPIYPVNPPDESIGLFTLESRILSAITGKEFDEEQMNFLGERIFNLNRAVLMRDGWGGRQGDTIMDYLYKEPLGSVFFNPDCLVPGKGGQPAERKTAVIERDAFERLKDEYYTLRGWDVESGYQTREKLAELGLSDIAAGLETRGLVR